MITLLETDRLIVRKNEGLVEFKAKTPHVSHVGRVLLVWRTVVLQRPAAAGKADEEFDAVVKNDKELSSLRSTDKEQP